MTYTIEQFLAAAEAAEVSMIDAQHICDTAKQMFCNKVKVGDFRKMIMYDAPYSKDEVILVIQVYESEHTTLPYKVINSKGEIEWIADNTHEPTTETF